MDTQVGRSVFRLRWIEVVAMVRASVVLCFAGWAWQHLRWGAPYRAVLKSSDHFEWLVRLAGGTWADYIGHPTTERAIGLLIQGIGGAYLIVAFATLLVHRRSTVLQAIVLAGSAMLFVLAYCKFLSRFQYWPQWVEYGGQILAPVILVAALTRPVHDRATTRIAQVAVVLTFLGHGLFALGYYPTPGHFTAMVMTIVGVDERTAADLLFVAGALDLFVCVGLFVPGVRIVALGYATVWGFATALARPLAGMSGALPWWGADVHLHEFLYRAPHFILPFFLLWRILHSDESVPRTSSGDRASR